MVISGRGARRIEGVGLIFFVCVFFKINLFLLKIYVFIARYKVSQEPEITISFDPVISVLKIENNYQKPKAILMKMITAASLPLKRKIGNELSVYP